MCLTREQGETREQMIADVLRSAIDFAPVGESGAVVEPSSLDSQEPTRSDKVRDFWHASARSRKSAHAHSRWRAQPPVVAKTDKSGSRRRFALLTCGTRAVPCCLSTVSSWWCRKEGTTANKPRLQERVPASWNLTR